MRAGASKVDQGGGDRLRRIVVAALVAVITLLMLAPSVRADPITVTVPDAPDDLALMYNTDGSAAVKVPPKMPIARAGYCDVLMESISRDAGTYVMSLLLAKDLPTAGQMPAGVSYIIWIFNIQLGLDDDNNRFDIRAIWNGVEYSGEAVDCRPLMSGGVPVVTPVQATAVGSELMIAVDADVLGDPASFIWYFMVVIGWGSYDPNTSRWGGWFNVDLTDPGLSALPWRWLPWPPMP